MDEYIHAKLCFLIYCESKAEWQCKMSMTKYGKHESDGHLIKWMRWNMVDKMKKMEYGRWN